MTKDETREYWHQKWLDILGRETYDPQSWYVAGYWSYLKGDPISYGNFQEIDRKEMWLQGYMDAKGDWEGE